MLHALGALVLPAAPLLVLVACLVLGRFPGEKAIEALSRRLAGSGRRHLRRDADRRLPAQPLSWSPRGGLLIAFGMARRPPPTAA